MPPAHRLSGRAAHYRPKSDKPVTLCLTDRGRTLLDRTAAKASASRSDVVEFLLRNWNMRKIKSEDFAFREDV